MMKNKFLAGLLAMLGFSGCSLFGDNDRGEEVVMYGVLRASFVVKGVVEDAAGKPVEGVRVVLRPASEDMYKNFLNDTVWTGTDGSFATGLRPSTVPGGYSVTAVDVKNGFFKPDERIFDFGRESSGYAWVDGAYLKQVRFVLEQATDIQDESE